jgi:hypothetical protein
MTVPEEEEVQVQMEEDQLHEQSRDSQRRLRIPEGERPADGIVIPDLEDL